MKGFVGQDALATNKVRRFWEGGGRMVIEPKRVEGDWGGESTKIGEHLGEKRWHVETATTKKGGGLVRGEGAMGNVTRRKGML